MPPSPRADLSDALAHHRQGRRDRAERQYRAILAREPGHADAHHLLGVLLGEKGEYEAAATHIRRALALAPKAAAFHHNLGLVLRQAGRLPEALEALTQATSLLPDDASLHLARGNLLHRMRRPQEAGDAYHLALDLDPALAPAHSDLGVLLMEVGRLDDAIASFSQAIRCKPDMAEVHANLGSALQATGRLGEAAASMATALHFRQDPVTQTNLANLEKEMGDLDGAIARYRHVLAGHPGNRAADSNLQMALHYATSQGNADFLAAAQGWAARQVPGAMQTTPLPPRPAAADGRVLRIGYISGDFKSHPVGYFLESVLASHDRRQVHITCYCNNDRYDGLTDRLRAAADGWVDIAAMDDDAAAARVRQDGIDILVDLSGHTDRNRLPLFARRPAPVQVTWLGYFGTTGLPQMDWVIADETVLPPAESRFFTEKVWHLPGSYLCFTPPEEAPPVAPSPLLNTGSLTFGSFHNRAKITPDTVHLWSRTLLAIPNARLLVKGRQFGDIGVRRGLRDQFMAQGVAPNRLRIEGAAVRSEYLKSYDMVDIVLDTVPFGGGTTTAEALWMGVPTLTLHGDRWAGRIGQGFLRALGLEDRLVAADPADFVAKATALAGDPPALATLRQELRDRFRQSPLCDAAGFTRRLEQAYRALWAA
ncbi:tetratricopeptide repeat protein [Niveispirillum fermenti]|uniref:O-linked N-acetylglucosamine transferase, SPINDLY family protein n=1 Tax=Niveispirillum fermenti TaxID=1233113 RepID=UPI003A874DA4